MKGDNLVKVLSFSAKSFAFLCLLLFGLTAFAFGQTPAPTPTLIVPKSEENLRVAERNNLYCAGYIQTAPVNTNFEIVGGKDERSRYNYSQGDYIYINRGAGSGARVGEVMSVIRPRGKFSSDFSRKGKLGIYVEEVGTLEIVAVKQDVSVARIKNSCQAFLLGDLVQPLTVRASPLFEQRPALDVFAAPSGKATGRIVLSRDAREALSREEIVYIDLGAEDNVRVGEYLTIFRPLGKGNVLRSYDEVSLNATSDDYGSKVYKGGKFSNQAPRKAGSNAEGSIVKTSEAKKGRPKNLREVVGEMVILNVKERTATAIITRGVTEIHTGDMVEVQ